jgi:DNA-binding HxlR family transcriptional regulator
VLSEENSVNSDETFEAISHPQRIKILKCLAKASLGFSELKRALSIESSGALDFHLKKMANLVAVDSSGRYALTREGYAALEAVNAIERYGWQKRAFYINIAAYLLVTLGAFMEFQLGLNFLVVLSLSTLWLAFYVRWMLFNRRIFIRHRKTLRSGSI